jgi:hypothetical protein
MRSFRDSQRFADARYSPARIAAPGTKFPFTRSTAVSDAARMNDPVSWRRLQGLSLSTQHSPLHPEQSQNVARG